MLEAQSLVVMRRFTCWLVLLAAAAQQCAWSTASAKATSRARPPTRRASHLFRVPHRLEQDAAFQIGVNLTNATRDIVAGLPVDRITLVFDGTIDARFRRLLPVSLHLADILTQSYSISTQKLMDEYIDHIRQTMARYEGMTSIIFCSRKSSEKLINTIRNANLIQRNILYMFYYELWPPSDVFLGALQEAMRVAVISNPRPGTYRIYYTQATPEGSGTLKLVNWWSSSATLFRYPVLPPASRIYTDLRGRTLHVPVLHKPPWNFVTYTNKTFLVEGGRDHELLLLLADKLHFRFDYFDPPERSQGSAFVETTDHNKTFPGIIGLISERRADLALGDITITFERSQAVEFSFLTLADSGAFVTKTPSRLNEALALVRPFQMEVWPVLVLTMLLTGPLLFGVLEAPRLWRGKAWMAKRGRKRISDRKLFGNAVWFSIALFFKQSVRGPEDSHRVRLLTILLSFAATYVIGDMYSANLTSLLARPGRERPISNLEQLAEAMETRGYQLLVEKHSSSYNVLENGTGVYERLWRLMLRQREMAEVASGEDGMVRVGREPNLAMLGGRETLYFDTRRFGAHRFHLSEKLYTRYSAIAMQIGCPYSESVNNILMQLFEAGILTKMTEEEYEKLGDKLHDQGPMLPERTDGAGDEDGQGDEEGGDGEDGAATTLTPADYGFYQEDDYYDYPQPQDYGAPNCHEGCPQPSAPSETSTATPPTTTTPTTTTPIAPEGPAEGSEREVKKGGRSTSSTDETLRPISIKMLQGAFYALLAGPRVLVGARHQAPGALLLPLLRGHTRLRRAAVGAVLGTVLRLLPVLRLGAGPRRRHQAALQAGRRRGPRHAARQLGRGRRRGG
ncbi:ionotropic receptor 40a isoform X2 [Frankliniella occidentalis]|uniref:Ionotropic receptor 40a isoform X2 n=1 Tax=Frankliniella occidentalis TaxID=133901 RepID=A0A9C6U409_FRAOC|nr:ionotropic receptor 40a isoform X2 [Frankliniella occidentalis]